MEIRLGVVVVKRSVMEGGGVAECDVHAYTQTKLCVIHGKKASLQLWCCALSKTRTYILELNSMSLSKTWSMPLWQ